jgi:predicted dehydrogenase
MPSTSRSRSSAAESRASTAKPSAASASRRRAARTSKRRSGKAAGRASGRTAARAAGKAVHASGKATRASGKATARAAGAAPRGGRSGARRIRYAVVGAGYITQAAMLPAFAAARRNSELVAIVSGDPVKRDRLGRRYGARITCDEDGYDRLLQSGDIDAVYIGLPNHLHAEYAVRAARAGIHVLCDKPLAMTTDECRQVLDAVDSSGIKFMVAYRLHFEAANLAALQAVRSGRLGEPRFFSSDFSFQVEPGNIRLRRETGGGTLYDIGIYCINAARTLFEAEPQEVAAFVARAQDERFAEVEEMASCLLRFPGERLATFTASFGAAATASYRVVGTKGDLCVDQAYEFEAPITHELTVKDRTRKRTFPRKGQFAAEYIYFSDCILDDEEPEPSALEGLADVRVIEALYSSAREGRPVKLPAFDRERRVEPGQRIARPASRTPELVHADDPSPEPGEAGSEGEG